VTKKSKQGRKAILSTRARKRLEKSMDRAEAVMERTAKKLQRSKGQVKNSNMKRRPWDEVNKQVSVKQNHLAGARDREEREKEGLAWETDEEMDGADESTLSAPAPGLLPLDAAHVPLPNPLDEDDIQ
jgi:hypothetical protein